MALQTATDDDVRTALQTADAPALPASPHQGVLQALRAVENNSRAGVNNQTGNILVRFIGDVPGRFWQVLDRHGYEVRLTMPDSREDPNGEPWTVFSVVPR